MRLQIEDNGDESFTLLKDVAWYDLETMSFIRVRAGEVTDFASVADGEGRVRATLTCTERS